MEAVKDTVTKLIYGDQNSGKGSDAEGHTQRSQSGTGTGREATADTGRDDHPDVAKYKPYEPGTIMRQETEDTKIGNQREHVGTEHDTGSGFGKPAPSSDVSGLGGRQEDILAETKDTRAPSNIEPRDSSNTDMYPGQTGIHQDTQTLAHEESSHTDLPSTNDHKTDTHLSSALGGLSVKDDASSSIYDAPGQKDDVMTPQQEHPFPSTNYKDDVSSPATGGFSTIGSTSHKDDFSTLTPDESASSTTHNLGSSPSHHTSAFKEHDTSRTDSGMISPLSQPFSSGIGRSQPDAETSHVDSLGSTSNYDTKHDEPAAPEPKVSNVKHEIRSIPLDTSAPAGPTHVAVTSHKAGTQPIAAPSLIPEPPEPSALTGAVHSGPSSIATNPAAAGLAQNDPSDTHQGSSHPTQKPGSTDFTSLGHSGSTQKSTGFAAEGGDFDATNPGAGHEADRLLDEKGLPHASKEKHHAIGLGHGHKDNTTDAGHGSGEQKMSTKDKIKEKLHIGSSKH